MPIWAIVPVKPFREAKSRLSPVLSAEERSALSRGFFTHTLEVLQQMPEVTRTLVISRDTAVLHLARRSGAVTVTESGTPELNDALARATEVSTSLGADAVLILPSDLPLVSPTDLRLLLMSLAGKSGLGIAPDRHESGTNALFVRPPGALSFAFGPGSFGRHIAQAAERSLVTTITRTPALGLDVDYPEDWELYRAKQFA